ncbi:unnamed protein product [Trifolium pratense]|uniref:Uncharacterized protein n=1 Tax=Trifolium pratense TaxID=57577 RepID=A0ACB0LS36_TRIPR|nr:unnamed protein product [Trifolium pratense]
MKKLSSIRGGKCALTQRDNSVEDVVDTTFVQNDDPLLVNFVITPVVPISIQNDNPSEVSDDVTAESSIGSEVLIAQKPLPDPVSVQNDRPMVPTIVNLNAGRNATRALPGLRWTPDENEILEQAINMFDSNSDLIVKHCLPLLKWRDAKSIRTRLKRVEDNKKGKKTNGAADALAAWLDTVRNIINSFFDCHRNNSS